MVQLTYVRRNNAYTFNWEKTVGGDVDSSFSGNTALIQNLSPGDYKVTVTDANDCSILSSTYTISQPDELKISIDPTKKFHVLVKEVLLRSILMVNQSVIINLF